MQLRKGRGDERIAKLVRLQIAPKRQCCLEIGTYTIDRSIHLIVLKERRRMLCTLGKQLVVLIYGLRLLNGCATVL